MRNSTAHPPPETMPTASTVPAAAPPALVEIARFRHKRDTKPERQRLAWDELVRRLLRHTVRAGKDGALWSPAAYPEGKTRKDEHVTSVTALVYDFDACTPDWHLLDGLAFVAHSTHSHLTVTEHNPTGGPCWRLVLRLRRKVPRADWERVWRRARARYAPGADSSCSDASRMYNLPSCPAQARDKAQAQAGEGAAIDPDALPETPEEIEARELAAARARVQAEAAAVGLPSAGAAHARRAGERPGDRFTRESTWAGILEPHGWRSPGEKGGAEVWNRPGRADDREARSTNVTRDGNLWVWSSNAPPFEANTSYTRLYAYVLLEHRGDWGAAIRALASAYETGEGAAPRVAVGPERRNGHAPPEDGGARRPRRPPARPARRRRSRPNSPPWATASGSTRSATRSSWRTGGRCSTGSGRTLSPRCSTRACGTRG